VPAEGIVGLEVIHPPRKTRGPVPLRPSDLDCNAARAESDDGVNAQVLGDADAYAICIWLGVPGDGRTCWTWESTADKLGKAGRQKKRRRPRKKK